MEAIGDITASADASRVEVDGPEFDTRIQGGVLVCNKFPMFDTLFTPYNLSLMASAVFSLPYSPSPHSQCLRRCEIFFLSIKLSLTK